MPVRDVETFFPVRDSPPRVLANRGANGIDGTVSTAFGVAADRRADRAAHRRRRARPRHRRPARRAPPALDLTIVLLNNDGGGIFHFLPVATEGADFEEHVATPHGLDFAHAAALYGLAHERVETPEALRAALDRAGTIIEVRTDREANVDLHRASGKPSCSPSAAGPSVPERATEPDRHPRSTRHRTAHDLEGHRPRRHRPGRQEGRRFHALVTELEQPESGRFELSVRPLDSRISYRTATVREVIDVWRKARRSA